MFNIEYDDASGVFEVKTWGFLSLEEYPRYAAGFRSAAAEARRRTGEVKVLIDLREAGVLPPEVAERTAAMKREVLFSDKDRVAVLVSSSLQKLQVNRVATLAQTKSFISHNAARTWLMAYATGLRGAA